MQLHHSTPREISFGSGIDMAGLSSNGSSDFAGFVLPPYHKNVVGLEEVTNTIINYLLEESSNLKVIRIFGMLGVGKTTLASRIFHHPRIQEEFVPIRWVNLSPPCKHLDGLVQELKSLKKSTGASLRKRKEKTSTREKLQLLFLDDILSGDMWNKLKAVLPEGCKVLITTSFRYFRDSKTSITIRLKCMDENTGWELLYLLVYGKLDDNSSPEMERIGKRIVRMCGGIPRAIELVSRVLAEKSTSTAGGNTREKIKMKLWEEVADNVKSYLFNNTADPQDMGNSISVRYNMLGTDLKKCFLYLGMLPAGIEIPVWKLTELWIAEGLVKPTNDKHVEAVARSNVTELSNRNLIIVKKWNIDYSPKTCCLHDMVREFSINENEVAKENICHEINRKIGPPGPSFEPPPPIEEMEKRRRLSIHFSSSSSSAAAVLHDFLLGKPKLPEVCSFLCFSSSDNSESIVLDKQDIQSKTDAFNVLSVLEANNIKFPKFPDKLSHLLQLKYMELSSDKIKVLPRTISQFSCIQTIIVNTMSPTLKVKVDIWEMMHLRLFKTKAAIILSEKGKGLGGKNLQTLGKLSPQSCIDQVANKAMNLVTLGIRGELANLLHSNFLEKFQSLIKLKLVNDHEQVAVTSKKSLLPILPTPSEFPPKLRTLVLSATFLSWEQMSILGNLGDLTVLILKDNAFMGDCWNSTCGGFLKLEFLSIGNTNLKRWTLASGDSFPKLRTLLLKHCQNLEGLPLELGDESPPLGKLEMKTVSVAAVSSAKEIERARRKMKRSFKLLIDTEDGDSTNGSIFSVEDNLGF